MYLVQMTASGDTTIGQWDVVRGESVATYKSHTGSVKSVDVNKDEPSECYNMSCLGLPALTFNLLVLCFTSSKIVFMLINTMNSLYLRLEVDLQ